MALVLLLQHVVKWHHDMMENRSYVQQLIDVALNSMGSEIGRKSGTNLIRTAEVQITKVQIHFAKAFLNFCCATYRSAVIICVYVTFR